MATAYQHRALVEGPYGKTLSFGQYGTVLLFATDMGIAGQLPYIGKLLERYQQCKVKTRRIALFWELEAEGRRSAYLFKLALMSLRISVLGETLDGRNALVGFGLCEYH